MPLMEPVPAGPQALTFESPHLVLRSGAKVSTPCHLETQKQSSVISKVLYLPSRPTEVGIRWPLSQHSEDQRG